MAQNGKKRIIIILVILVALVAIVAILSTTKKDKGIGVGITKVENTKIVEIVSANGKINPITQVKISPDVSGEIVELNVEEGDYVNKGDFLVKIKPDIYESMKLRSEAAVNSAIAQKEQISFQLVEAKQSFERNKSLYEQNAITQKEYEQSVASYNSLQAQLKSAEYGIESSKASLKESIENLDKTYIVAPMNGVVSKLNVELGERVVGTGQMAGTEMLIIANLKAMEINAEINENDIVRVSEGDSAVIEIDAYPNKKFKGVVTQIANSANQTTSLEQVTNFKVDIHILPASYEELVTENNPYPLRPGLSTSIEIATKNYEGAAVPIQAVKAKDINGELKEIVYVYNADSMKVFEKIVISGVQDLNNIEIQGLELGEKVVIEPIDAIQRKLKDGSKVIINQ